MAIGELEVVSVIADWLPQGGFALYGVNEWGDPIEESILARILFAWDPDSYYGTMCEFVEWEETTCIYLSPLRAVRYFARSAVANSLSPLQYDEEFEALRTVAAKVLEAFREGWFVPDFVGWQAGDMAWKLRLPREVDEAFLISLDYADEWVNQAIQEHIASSETTRVVFAELLEAHPLLSPLVESSMQEPEDGKSSGMRLTDLYADEMDWLIALGWMEDVTPFRVGLQLMEPVGEEGVWGLQVILQDKAEMERVFPYWDTGEQELPQDCASFGKRIETQIQRIRRLVPWLAENVNETAGVRTSLDGNEAFRFLSESSQTLSEAGILLLVPAWWAKVQQASSRLKASVKSSVGSRENSLFGLDQTVDFDWRYSIGDMDISDADFARLLAQKQRLVQFRGQWVQIDPDFYRRAGRLKAQVAKRNGLSLRDVLESHLLAGGAHAESGEAEDTVSVADTGLEIELNEHLFEMMRTLEHQTQAPTFEVPPGFHGQLRPYQQQGYSWLTWLRQYGFGACLADDMGLGKTVQYIAYLLAIRASKEDLIPPVKDEAAESIRDAAGDAPSLLICPTSVLGNWQKELSRFAPGLKVYIHYGAGRLHGEGFAAAIAGNDVVLTTYTLSNLDESDLAMVTWNSTCLDEAQNIKNAYTKQSQAIRRLSSRHRIAMTGTPMENRLTELWSIFDFTNPGYLGSLRRFSETFVNPIERMRDTALIGQVQRLVRPFLLRRVKTDPKIELDLPDKTEMKVFVSLTAEQAALYESVLQDMLNKLDTLPPMERRGLILATLTRLKQICDHPALALKDATDHRTDVSRSAKMERIVEMVGELRSEGDKCLVFTQFVEAGRLLQRAFEEALSETTLFLHGGISKAKRDAMIAEFQREPQTDGQAGDPGVFILSLKAGGVGLNLTAANHVFHFDRWWNPAVENQATDRAFRIGQTRHVQVHKFVALGTLEERIDEMIERKQSLNENIVGAGEQWITEMSTSELRDLFALRREWVTE